MDKNWQGVFDQGFSGILEDSTRKMMPDYIDKLAEQEVNYSPTEVEGIKDLFQQQSGLIRANELTSDGCRDIPEQNKHTTEKKLATSEDNKLQNIDSSVEKMLSDGKKFEEIQASLLSKYPKEILNKYLEAKIKLFLDKYSQLGFTNIKIAEKNIVSQASTEFQVKRATANDILHKFAKLEYVTEDVFKDYKKRLSSERPLKVVCSFLFSLDTIKRAYYQKHSRENDVFKRDIDEKQMSLRDINVNLKRNSLIEQENKLATILTEFKEDLYAGMSRSQIDKKVAKTHGIEALQKFHSKFANEITRIEKFKDRQAFSTNFASLTDQGVEVTLQNKPVSIDAKEMLSFASRDLTNGATLKQASENLTKQYGIDKVRIFMISNEDLLKKVYGQLGYTYIDSDVYDNCEQMKKHYFLLPEVSQGLIANVKSTEKCKTCNQNRCDTCQKVGLKITDSPLIRSLRAAKKIFEKAASFAPRSYIENYSNKIGAEADNKRIVAEFALGLRQAMKTVENFNLRSEAQAFEIEPKSKVSTIDCKTMSNYTGKLMTSGNSFNTIKEALKKKFGVEETQQFLASNQDKIMRDYGQLGYVFIDSNLYSSCDEMKEAFSSIQHEGKQLISSIKTNSKCKGCQANKEGTCQKVAGLILSNSPLVRSPRAARKIFEKAATFVPKAYIDDFVEKINEEGGNKELVSRFTLSLKKVLSEEKKNIGKTAARDRSMNLEIQESFGDANSFDVEIFKGSNESDIIDSVLKG